MKIRTIIQTIAFLVLGSMITFSCNKDSLSSTTDFESALKEEVTVRSVDEVPQVTGYEEINPADFPELQIFLESDDYLNFANAVGTDVVSYFQVFTDQDYSFFAVDFAEIDGLTTTLALYPKDGTVLPLIVESHSVSDELMEASYVLFSSNENIGSIFVNTGDGGGGDTVFRKKCNQSDSYKECIKCSVDELGSDPVSSIACLALGQFCAIGVLIHCARGDYDTKDVPE